MSSTPLRFAPPVMAALFLSAAFAAVGIAEPSLADLPLIVFWQPLVAAAIIFAVFVISLANRQLGIFAAIASATPMFMLVGAPPAGVVGALSFFGAGLVVGAAGFLLAIGASRISSTLRR